MKKTNKVIVTSATTGAMHLPCMSPYLPVTPDEIVADSLSAAREGASIIHLHARDPEHGFPVTDPSVYKMYIERIVDESDAIINITTGQPNIEALGNWPATLEARLDAPKALSPEICSFNMGPMNPGIWMLKDKLNYQHDWERMMTEGSKDATIMNTGASMERFAKELGQERGIRFEYECFDIGHLYMLDTLANLGWIEPPFFIQSIFGFPGGLGTDASHIVHMRETADRLFGDDYIWSVLAAGKDQMKCTTMSAIMGGNVRVGLEDSLWYGKGQLAKNSGEQVKRIVSILKELSLEIATPDEAREILGTKGRANTNY
ncbi:3-keto-5-aminohexanoate cleavage protein [Pseudomaricurvus alkylphenolicus]|uniref:3-keto-5-aminohexanoate cleavage protein n=1 Tax=Pseudomaricurvus alkylphenolicus TaxID=1306991 RepID=UPI0014224EE4|nr:3-keto-5-aminohexanoate cleavage protein [Pseudomaricurvus alkylphenolicus]NIB42460.1 3-keto-5-aminohexanoate cleavage protein [Pseudomaricurvus alkylphenolicus]